MACPSSYFGALSSPFGIPPPPFWDIFPPNFGAVSPSPSYFEAIPPRFGAFSPETPHQRLRGLFYSSSSVLLAGGGHLGGDRDRPLRHGNTPEMVKQAQNTPKTLKPLEIAPKRTCPAIRSRSRCPCGVSLRPLPGERGSGGYRGNGEKKRGGNGQKGDEKERNGEKKGGNGELKNGGKWG